jgi:hypothetical protein
MERIIEFTKKPDSKDKLCKLLMYISRSIKALSSSRNVVESMDGLRRGLRDGRRVFRLLKTIEELHKLNLLIGTPYQDRLLKFYKYVSLACYAIYWVFDSWAILISLRVISGQYKHTTRIGYSFKFFGLVFSLLEQLRSLMKSYAQEAMLVENSLGNKTQRQACQILEELSTHRLKLLLMIARTLGDMIPTSNEALIPYRLLGKQFSEKWVGVGGIVSASISCFEIWSSN